MPQHDPLAPLGERASPPAAEIEITAAGGNIERRGIAPFVLNTELAIDVLP